MNTRVPGTFAHCGVDLATLRNNATMRYVAPMPMDALMRGVAPMRNVAPMHAIETQRLEVP